MRWSSDSFFAVGEEKGNAFFFQEMPHFESAIFDREPRDSDRRLLQEQDRERERELTER